MTQFLDRASMVLIGGLVSSAARSIVIAAVAAAGIAAFRVKNTSLRLLIWASVMYASLALPLLGGFIPVLQIPISRFSALGTSASPSRNTKPQPHLRYSAVPLKVHHNEVNAFGHETRPVASRELDHRTDLAESARGLFARILSWNIVAAVVYLAVTFFFSVRFLIGALLSRKLAREAQDVAGSIPQHVLPIHYSSKIRIAVSPRISVPITVGISRPTILLPADWQGWDEAKLTAVLAHEKSHVARRDPLTQCFSLLYRAFFWFNPLAWWIHRQLVTLAELASDEAALSGGVDKKHYARTLLGFFEAMHRSPGRIRWQGVSMARAGQAEQRMERILEWKGSLAMNFKRSLAVAVIVLAIPVVVLVAAVRPVSHVSVQVAPAVNQSAPSAPALAPNRGVTGVPPVAAIGSSGPVTAIAPTPAISVSAAVPSVAPVAPVFGQHYSTGSGSFYSYGFDDDERYVITSGKSDSYTMSGSTQDIRHVEKLKKQIPGDFIWFQRDEESYIIRDQATVDRARQLFKPQEELGRQQEELGKQQEALGKQQEELGKKMEEVRINVPDMTAELDRLKAKLQKMGPTATMDQIGDLQSEIGELQSKIGDLQGHAGEEQGKLGELQGELGEKQGKLGEEQGKLGEKQGELAERASKEMRALLDEAIKNGTAKPERDTVKGSGSL
jgi:beta-lactamase regulating signal transducer with metallopeptidase domain